MKRALFVLMLAACKKDSGPPCDKVVDHMMEVTKQTMTSHGGLELQNRKAMVDQCEARKLSAEARQCLLDAKSLAEIANCTPAKPQGSAR